MIIKFHQPHGDSLEQAVAIFLITLVIPISCVILFCFLMVLKIQIYAIQSVFFHRFYPRADTRLPSIVYLFPSSFPTHIKS